MNSNKLNAQSWKSLLEEGEQSTAQDKGGSSDFVEHHLQQIIEEVSYNNRILLVDDETQNIKALMAILEAEESIGQLDEDLVMLQQMFSSSPEQEHGETGSQFWVCAAESGEAAVQLVEQQKSAAEPFALAFIDMRMPNGMDGLQTAKEIRSLSPDIEIVIMRAWSDYTLEQIRAVLGHNFTYMGKPFNNDDVSQRAVEGCAKWYRHQQSKAAQQALIEISGRMEREIVRRKKLESELERVALYDQLTGLPNRALFNEHLLHAVAHAQRSGDYLLLMFIDLDHFKQVNDTRGHGVGDLLLQQVATVLNQQVREEDIPCRWAGDEFAVLMTDLVGLKDIEMIAERVCTALNQIVELDGEQTQMGASVGIVYYASEGASQRGRGLEPSEQLAQSLLDQADRAMYQSKRSGRGGYLILSHSRQ